MSEAKRSEQSAPWLTAVLVMYRTHAPAAPGEPPQVEYAIDIPHQIGSGVLASIAERLGLASMQLKEQEEQTARVRRLI